ncbi:MAG TPA: SseB family protein [Microlunatus sp.]
MGESTQGPRVTYAAVMIHDRQLASSAFPGDDGQASESLRTQLALATDGSADSYLRAVAALGEARLLVPVVAAVTETGSSSGGLRVEKEADMSVVLWQAADGRRCAVGFTGLDSLAAWHPEARPVPVTVDVLAKAALDDHAVALIIDVAGPASLVVEGDLLSTLANGQRLVALSDGGFGWLSLSSEP